MDEKLLELLGSAGAPTTMVGGLLLLFFYLRKAEAGMRSEINSSLVRLQKEKTDLQAVIDKLEGEAQAREIVFDGLREERREAQDGMYAAIRRAEAAERRAEIAEEKLRKNGIA